MIAIPKSSAPLAFRGQGMEVRSVEAGTMFVGMERWPVGNLEGLFDGLPSHECRAEHWGYTVQGKWRVRTQDGEETIEAGQAYHLPRGHTLVAVLEPLEIVEFTPIGDPYLAETVKAFQANLPRVLPLLKSRTGNPRRRL